MREEILSLIFSVILKVSSTDKTRITFSQKTNARLSISSRYGTNDGHVLHLELYSVNSDVVIHAKGIRNGMLGTIAVPKSEIPKLIEELARFC